MYLICKDAREDSLLGNLMLGLELKKAGEDVAVVFTAESLLALTGREVRSWPPLLNNRRIQVSIARSGKETGYDMNAEFDSRWLETDRFIQFAVKKDLAMIACPLWTQLLGIGEELPDFLLRPLAADYAQSLRDAKQIIGGL